MRHFQVVDVANPAMVDALLEHAPHLVHGIYVRAIQWPSNDEMKSGVLRDKNSTVSPSR